MFESHSIISFHHLKVSTTPDENGLYALVRWDTDESLKLGKEGIDSIKFLSEGKTIQETAHMTKIPVSSVKEFLQSLQDNSFIKSVDNKPITDSVEKIHPWLTSIDRKYFKIFISKPFLYLSFIFIISGICLGIFVLGYFPNYKNYFWTNDLLTVLVSITLIDIILVIIHELGHFIATKAVGGEAKMRINYRFMNIVAETESYHLSILPKELRYFVYSAGMFIDFLIISLLYWFIFIISIIHAQSGFLRNFFSLIILLEVTGIIWQYNVFLETDMYNFLSDYLNVENLRGTTRKFLLRKVHAWKNQLLQPLKKLLTKLLYNAKDFEASDDLRFLNIANRRKITIYSFIFISGLLFYTLQYVLLLIPRDITFLFQGASNLFTALLKGNILKIFESIILLLLLTYQYILLLYLATKKRLKRHV